jgi:hypothetical protein
MREAGLGCRQIVPRLASAAKRLCSRLLARLGPLACLLGGEPERPPECRGDDGGASPAWIRFSLEIPELVLSAASTSSGRSFGISPAAIMIAPRSPKALKMTGGATGPNRPGL